MARPFRPSRRGSRWAAGRRCRRRRSGAARGLRGGAARRASATSASCSSWPSSVNETPSGWTMSSGLRSVRGCAEACSPSKRNDAGRDRHGGLFEHLQHLVVEQVDDGHDALNGPSVAVVVLGVAQVGDGLEDAVFGLPLVAEVAGRPGVDLDRLELLVGDALALHRSAPRGVTLDGLPGRARTPPSAGRAGRRCAASTIRRCRC